LPQGIQLLGRVGMADLIVACSHWSAACFAARLSPTHLAQQIRPRRRATRSGRHRPVSHASVLPPVRCVYGHKVAKRKIRRQLRCRLWLILLGLWREGITADLDQAAGVLGFCSHGRDGYCVRPWLFRELGQLEHWSQSWSPAVMRGRRRRHLGTQYFCWAFRFAPINWAIRSSD